MEELIQRIGIDRTVLFDFEIDSINADLIYERLYFGDHGSHVVLTYNDESPLTLDDGYRVGQLTIKDLIFGKLDIRYCKNNFDWTESVRSTLEMSVSSSGDNTQNLTTSEYRQRLNDVFGYLCERYGIHARYESIKLRRIEINATIQLDESFDKYRLPLLLIAKNLPGARWGSGSSKAIKVATWSKVLADQEYLETVLVKNSSLEFKIYNKKAWAEDHGHYEYRGDLLRVEYTIRDARLLKKYMDSSYVSDLTDDGIKAMFKAYFEKDVVRPYHRYREDSLRQLTEVVQEYRQRSTHWVSPFLRYCREYNATHSKPLIFDIEDMRYVFRQMDGGRRNADKKFKRFSAQCTYEQDLVGNTRRIREIIDKIANL